MPAMSRVRIVGVAAAVTALAFGVLTVISGGKAIFGDEAAREAVGAAVPFVLWFNFCAGFAYVAAGAGLLMQWRWAAWLSATIAAATALVFLAFGIHVLSGGAYEMRTVVAMTFRSLFWIGVAFFVLRMAGSETSRRPASE